MIILALISAAAFPTFADFLLTGAETVNIQDEVLSDGLFIFDNTSYSQSFTVPSGELNSICLELTSAADSIANFSISIYGEESEYASTTEFDELEAEDNSRFYWNLEDTGLIEGETATLSIFMGGSEGGNNPIIHSIEYNFGKDTLSASRLIILVMILVILSVIFSFAYLGITKAISPKKLSSIPKEATPKLTSRRVYFEIMRILACGLVIFNHLPIYNQYFEVECESRTFYMTLSMITRMNVPLFFMVSGALLLKKDEEFTAVFRKRFLRIIGLLIVFYLINIAAMQYNAFLRGDEYNISVKDFALGFLSRNLPGSEVYWYLYAYLGYLFVLPLLQRLAKGITRAEVLALILLHFITASLIPMINLYYAKNGISENISIDFNFNVPFAFVQAFFYPLIGYYLEYKVDFKKVKPWQLCLLIMGATTGITLSNICTYTDAELNGAFSQSYVMLFDYLTAISAFILIKYLYTLIKADRESGIVSRAICFIGSTTLGIYMFDPVIKELLYLGFWDIVQSFSVLGQGLLWVLFSMTLGTAITFLLKRIQLFKSLL
jgi:surface polysaccharide O-acyltransferase-like enzyme